MKIEYNGKYISYLLCQISDTIYLKYNITYFVIYNRNKQRWILFCKSLIRWLIYRKMDSVLFVVVLITFEDITFAFNYRVSSVKHKNIRFNIIFHLLPLTIIPYYSRNSYMLPCPLSYWFNIFRKSFCKNLVGKSYKAMQSNRHLLLLIAQSSGKCYQGWSGILTQGKNHRNMLPSLWKGMLYSSLVFIQYYFGK